MKKDELLASLKSRLPELHASDESGLCGGFMIISTSSTQGNDTSCASNTSCDHNSNCKNNSGCDHNTSCNDNKVCDHNDQCMDNSTCSNQSNTLGNGDKKLLDYGMTL